MLSSDEQARKVTLNVSADTPMTEIFVIDGKFQRVSKGLGKLNVDLPPGLYEVKFKSGSSIRQVPVALEPGTKDLNVDGPPMDVFSSAPITDSRTAQTYDADAARKLSAEVHANVGAGSQIFVFTRAANTGDRDNVMSGLTLHDLSGRMLVDFSTLGRIYPQTQPASGESRASGCNVAVNPGSYRLRVRVSESLILEQSVVACWNWQTQVFLNGDGYVLGESAPFPDLTTASIFMARPERGYEAGSPEIRLTELARQGLVNQRNVMSQSDLRELLWAKADNPMFGIYGAHLLLLTREPDRSLLRSVVDNLHSLVGDHPDVRALDIYLTSRTGGRGDFAQYTAPPMLRSSWDLVVSATSSMPELVPPEAFSSQIADRIWGNSLWLIWLSPESIDDFVADDTGASASLPAMDWTAARGLASRIPSLITDRSQLADITAQLNLTQIQQDLLNIIYGAARSGGRRDATDGLNTEQSPSSTSVDDPLSPAGLINSLGIPASMANAALEALNEKLGRLPS